MLYCECLHFCLHNVCNFYNPILSASKIQMKLAGIWVAKPKWYYSAQGGTATDIRVSEKN